MTIEFIKHIDYMLGFLLNPKYVESLERLQLKSLVIKRINNSSLKDVLIEKNILNQELIIKSEIFTKNLYEISIIYFIKGKRKYYLHSDSIDKTNYNLCFEESIKNLNIIQNKLLGNNDFFKDIDLQKLLNQENNLFCLQGVIYIILDYFNEKLSNLHINFYKSPILDKLMIYSLGDNELLIEQNNQKVALALNKANNNE